MNTIHQARIYVGTTPLSGISQFRLLLREGVLPSHRVLEYGCGALHLAKPLIDYLHVDGYIGVEPNLWLVIVALGADSALDAMVEAKRARVSTVDNFAPARMSVDYIYGHSVMSHMAGWQLPIMLRAAVDRLAPGGRIIMSYRDGPDTDADDWTYPEATFFSAATIEQWAETVGLHARFMPLYRELHSAVCPDEVHDWVVFE